MKKFAQPKTIIFLICIVASLSSCKLENRKELSVCNNTNMDITLYFDEGTSEFGSKSEYTMRANECVKIDDYKSKINHSFSRVKVINKIVDERGRKTKIPMSNSVFWEANTISEEIDDRHTVYTLVIKRIHF